MDEFEKELKEGFLEESETLLEDAEQSLLELENIDDDHTEVINKLFRAAHNLKGTSRAVGFGELAEFTHEMENLILKIKNQEMAITPQVVTVLLESFDQIGVMVQGLKVDLDASFDCSEHVSRILSVLEGGGDVAEADQDSAVQSEDYENSPIQDIDEDLEPMVSLDEYPTEEDFASIDETQSFEEAENKDYDKIEATNSTEIQESSNEFDLSNLENIESEGFSIETSKQMASEEIEEDPTEQPSPPPSAPRPEQSIEEAPSGEDEEILAELMMVRPVEAQTESVEEPSLITDNESSDFLQATEEEPKSDLKPEPSQPEAKPVVDISNKNKVPPSSGSSGGKSSPSKPIDETIRVKLSRLEVLNNFVGELVILQSVLNQHRTEVKSPIMLKSLGQLGKLSKEIHEISMSLRMLPIKPTLQKMQRIVRDTSRTLNKKVNLITKGEETEVDKTVLEHLNDPLTHIIRNAVDHGMESPEERIQLGKPEMGDVVLSCFHEGNNLVIEITDDGKGIDPEIVRQKAIEKGVIKPDSSLTDDELINLIFHPGFSTKSEVSEVSGRGVGMDVVKTNIQNLNGEIIVQSEIGKGSIFKISLPLTMAVIDGMVTQVGVEKYVFPLSQIQETLKPEDKDVTFITGMGSILHLRGENLPLYQVSDVLKRPSGNESKVTDQIAVIVRNGKQSYALLVDEIHHQQQVVIKSLGKEIEKQSGFMGTSILGDGLPAFILDLSNLVTESTNNIKGRNLKGAA